MLVAPAGTVSGRRGIVALAAGSGTATVNVANNVTGTAVDGVATTTSAGLNTVNVTAGTIQGAQNGIAATSATGNINVTIGAGAAAAGTTNFGLSIVGGTTNTIVNNGTITGNARPYHGRRERPRSPIPAASAAPAASP